MSNSRNETFGYDALNRLTSSSYPVGWIGGGMGYNNTVSMTYNPNGNITNKSDVGAYQYGKPHAVTGITLAANSEAGTVDAITNTSYNRVSSITRNGAVIQKLNFDYNPDNQRNKMVYSENGVAKKTTYYVGNYEKIVNVGGTTEENDYICTPEGLSAIAKKTGGTTTFYYVNTDHLGSIRTITDASKNIINESYYDAWGVRTSTGSSITTRGYTGHEHLPEFGLINMNARLYDPLLGRFLEADPYVANSTFSQDFNRYSYARNNPLATPLQFSAAAYSPMQSTNIRNVNVVLNLNATYSTNIYSNTYSSFVSNGRRENISGGGNTKKRYTDPWGLWTYKVEAREGDELDESTWGKNLFGYVYPGANNPKDKSGNWYYGDLDKLHPNDFPGLQHDLAYDKLDCKGPMGLVSDSRAIIADQIFVFQHYWLINEFLFDGQFKEAAHSFFMAAGLDILSSFKREPFFATSFLETHYFNKMINNQNLTNSQKNWAMAGNYVAMSPMYTTAASITGLAVGPVISDIVTGGPVTVTLAILAKIFRLW